MNLATYIQQNSRAKPIFFLTLFLLSALALGGCQIPSQSEGVAGKSSDESSQMQAASASAASQPASNSSQPSSDHNAVSDEQQAEADMPSPIELNPERGQEVGSIFEAFLSPHQEGGEEEDTPSLTPNVFKSTAPSVPRNERQSRGHGVLSFTNDLSRAFVHVAIEGVNTDDIVMFHIHCGRPGQLGPIIVDFALMGDLQSYWEDNMLVLEVTNEDIVATTQHGHGIVGAFTAGCPITLAIPTDKVKTIAGMELIARQGELYFNLHTKGQTFFGDIRGQLHQVK